MRLHDIEDIDEKSFAFLNATARDVWMTWTPVFTSLTVVGNTTYSGRFRVVGHKCEFQVSLLAATSIASTAGTTYMALPVPAKGIAGSATMTDATAKVAVGTCHIDVTNSRCYLPTQSASGNSFKLYGSYEI